MSCSRTQRSEAGEAGTHVPSVSSQGLYHCAPALPLIGFANEFFSLYQCFVSAVEACKFEVLGTRGFISNYQWFKL